MTEDPATEPVEDIEDDEVGDDETGEVVEIDTILAEPADDEEDPPDDEEDDGDAGLAHDDDPFGTGF